MRSKCVLSCLIIVGVLTFCWVTSRIRSFSNRAQGSGQKLLVVCTTGMIADAAQKIGGDDIQVMALMGPGIDPHLYRARESDMHALSQADVILFHGLHLEGRLGEIVYHTALNARAVTAGIATDKLIPSEITGVYDPHVWHDVSLWRDVVQEITKIISETDPSHADEYRARERIYRQELDALDHEIKTVLETIPPERRCLVTAHDAFAYFGRAYGFDVLGLQGISTNAHASARDVCALVDYLVDHHIPAIFCESSVSSRGIQALQEATAARGWHVERGQELFSDALGYSGSGADDYLGMMRHNVWAIVGALTLEACDEL